MSTIRHITLYRDEAGLWIADCPSLGGCQSFRTTRDEAISQVQSVISLFVDAANEMGDPIPPDQSAEETRQLWINYWQAEGLPMAADQLEVTTVDV